MKIIVGNTSQISHYFPNDYIKISSRDIPSNIFDKTYEEVHLAFGLNIKGLEDNKYDEINYYYTYDLVKEFLKKSEKIVVYSTCELWSSCWGGINLQTPFNFYDNPYILSKWKITEKLKSLNSNKIIIVYPFNFNSIHRTKNFLFGKIFGSILNKEKIEIGDTYFYRDILHTSYVANICTKLSEDKIIGSGRLVYLNDFIRELYTKMDLVYDDFVYETLDDFNFIPKNEYYLKGNQNYPYDNLIKTTLNELKNGRKLTEGF